MGSGRQLLARSRKARDPILASMQVSHAGHCPPALPSVAMRANATLLSRRRHRDSLPCARPWAQWPCLCLPFPQRRHPSPSPWLQVRPGAVLHRALTPAPVCPVHASGRMYACPPSCAHKGHARRVCHFRPAGFLFGSIAVYGIYTAVSRLRGCACAHTRSGDIYPLQAHICTPAHLYPVSAGRTDQQAAGYYLHVYPRTHAPCALQLNKPALCDSALLSPSDVHAPVCACR